MTKTINIFKKIKKQQTKKIKNKHAKSNLKENVNEDIPVAPPEAVAEVVARLGAFSASRSAAETNRSGNFLSFKAVTMSFAPFTDLASTTHHDFVSSTVLTHKHRT
jgi:hypothetical protein